MLVEFGDSKEATTGMTQLLRCLIVHVTNSPIGEEAGTIPYGSSMAGPHLCVGMPRPSMSDTKDEYAYAQKHDVVCFCSDMPFFCPIYHPRVEQVSRSLPTPLALPTKQAVRNSRGFPHAASRSSQPHLLSARTHCCQPPEQQQAPIVSQAPSLELPHWSLRASGYPLALSARRESRPEMVGFGIGLELAARWRHA
nr:hypothetical protein CFP56_09220 [Quercus suber]